MKTNLKQLLALCALLSIPCTLSAADRTRFAAADISQADFFPILPWDALHGFKGDQRPDPAEDLKNIAACHFNLAGFVQKRDLRQCEKLGLGAILYPYEANATPRAWTALPDAEIEAKVKQMIRNGGKNQSLVGYFIIDEPGVKDFRGMATAVATVKKYAPGKLAYINLFPNYATIGAHSKSQLGTQNYTEYLERFVNEVHPQLISYDNYRVEISEDLKNPEKAASYYQNLLEVRRVAQKYHLPYLNIVTSNQIRPYATPPSPANLLFQAYTTLAAGYRGVTWFTYFPRGYHYEPINPDGTKSQTWFYLQEVNRQIATLAPILSKLTSTGVYFSKPVVENLPLLPGTLVQSANCESPLMIGEFKDNAGNNYLMVVNLSLERSAKFSLKLQNEKLSLKSVSTVDTSLTPFDEKNGLWLVAGAGVLLKMD